MLQLYPEEMAAPSLPVTLNFVSAAFDSHLHMGILGVKTGAKETANKLGELTGFLGRSGVSQLSEDCS